MAISEHWVYENRLSCLSDISHTHNCFARASNLASAENYGAGRGQGGIALFWDKSIKGVSTVADIVLDRACAIRLQMSSGAIFYFVSVYLPAMGCSESLDSALDDITELVESRETDANVIVLGDFNGDVGSSGGPRGTRRATPRGEKVANFFNRHSLIPVNMQYITRGPVDTYEGQVNGSTLDYIAVPHELMDSVTNSLVHEWAALNTSDHVPISVTLSLNIATRTNDDSKTVGHIKWNKLTAWDKFCKYQCVLEPLLIEIEANFNNSLKLPSDIDRAFSKLIAAIHCVAETLPHSKFKKNLRPYWNCELSHLKCKKVASYKQWVAAGRPRAGSNNLYAVYKSDKKLFHSTLKRLSKEYENQEILEAVRSAEFNRNSFWKLISTARKSPIKGVTAIRRTDKVVVHEVHEVLDVWASHFLSIGTPKCDSKFDDVHFRSVTEFVEEYNRGHEDDRFLDTPFSINEVSKAISTLHSGKAPGFDGVMSEHLSYAGPILTGILCNLYNSVRRTEYIPLCFKLGVQIPLYKGKDTCVLDPNNYRGITLLPTFNKLFEILLWQRMKDWWHDECIMSELQGACREGASCIHTAFILRETIATSMESSRHCFVAFFDVAKAFDTVWIDGLFKQMFDLGISGKTWRLLYRGYLNFKCCVKIQGSFSEWYEPRCGIHQGGFMSLMKYAIFINSLLVDLKKSGLCCKIYRTPSTPLGYADDVATCCLSKQRLDKAMALVHAHGCTWRYDLNAKKSGVLVYGESIKEHECNSVDRIFKLGPNRVNERVNYDHVGIRNTIFNSDISGIEERISKGRRSFNSVAGIGVRKGGITMATCNVIFWSIVVPTTLYGCELWILDDPLLNVIEEFQNYIGKRVQRFHPKVPNVCSYYGLGWMRLERIIQIRKLMFIRTILIMDENSLTKKMFCERAEVYFSEDHVGTENGPKSIVFDLLEVSALFGMLDEVKGMVQTQRFYPKSVWREMVWKRGWALEDVYWRIEKHLHKSLDILSNVSPIVRYLPWWSISDKYPKHMKDCEILSRIVCHASLLRDDDFKYKNQIGTNRMCNLCDRFEIENARHFILLCPYFAQQRNLMLLEIEAVTGTTGHNFFDDDIDMLYRILGRPNSSLNAMQSETILLIILRTIASMYRENIRQKKGVG